MYNWGFTILAGHPSFRPLLNRDAWFSAFRCLSPQERQQVALVDRRAAELSRGYTFENVSRATEDEQLTLLYRMASKARPSLAPHRHRYSFEAIRLKHRMLAYYVLRQCGGSLTEEQETYWEVGTR
jgi:hypothetical protein